MKGHSFEYTYTANQRDEINNIRKKYLPKEDEKMEKLRRLDKSVTKKGIKVSLALGIIGVLLLGAGMSLTMVWGDTPFWAGVITGFVGIAAIAAAFPAYSKITAMERKRLAPEILKLAEELSQES